MNNNFFGSSESDDKKVINPIYFIKEGEDYRENPIYKLNDGKNTPQRFIIVKTTANGKYHVGKMIHYTYKGIDIITDEDNAIFVDTVNDTIFVREYEKALREENPTDPEERQYVLLLYGDTDEEAPTWESIVGRTPAYDYIKNHVGLFDPGQSIVLTENVALKDALTITQFVNHLHNANIVDDDFDINYYDWSN